MDSTLVFPGLALARVFLALVPLPGSIQYNHLLSSPLTSFLRLREGLYLFETGIDPYSGGVFRHNPLYLSLFSTIFPTGRKGAALLWTACDALGAWALIRIWRARNKSVETKPGRERSGIIAATYLLNPYIVLPSLALSTSSFDNTLTLLVIMFASQGNLTATLLTLSLLTQLSISSVLLFPPLVLLLLSTPASHLASPRSFPIPVLRALRRSVPVALEFLLYLVCLTLSSTLVAGGFTWVDKTWGASLSLPDLTPNPGLWWYFFTEMFDHFRPFFLMVFSVHLVIYVAPLCIKFQHDPLYATFIMLGVLATFKSYPTLSDPGLFLSMIALFPETFPYMRHPFVTTFLHLHASLLMPLFHHLWLSQGTGNANFFYASTLVFGCANAAALVDCIWAGLRVAIGKEQDRWEVVQE